MHPASLRFRRFDEDYLLEETSPTGEPVLVDDRALSGPDCSSW